MNGPRRVVRQALAALSLCLPLCGAAQLEIAAAWADEAGPREQAREQFERGYEAQARGDCETALAAFLRSRALFPTRNATNNTAVCLLRLDRAPEALVMFETLLRDFPDLPAQDKRAAQYEIQKLREVVGSLDVRGAPVGAQLVVDGRYRGEVPLLSPVRVRSGSHLVSVYLEGYTAYTQRVEVAGGESVTLAARLTALERSQWLQVSEASGLRLDVVVDGIALGRTPWRGRVALGQHVIWLSGQGRLGSEPARIELKPGRSGMVQLVAIDLPALTEVQVQPLGARISVDSVEVGQGVWRGRLSAGTHRFESAAAGFVPESREQALVPGDNQLRFELARDPESSLWRRPSHIVFDAVAALSLAPTLGGDVSGGCAGACKAAAPLGFTAQGFAGYELGSGVSFGAWAGYLSLTQRLTDRPLELLPVGLPPRAGVGAETLRVRGGLTGAALSYHVGELPSFQARLAAGAFIGDVGNLRTAVVAANRGDFAAPDVASSSLSPFLALSPDLRVGIALSDRFELGFAVNALLLFPTDRPRWGADGSHPVIHPDDGFSDFASETLVGPAILVISPGLSVRYSQ